MASKSGTPFHVGVVESAGETVLVGGRFCSDGLASRLSGHWSDMAGCSHCLVEPGVEPKLNVDGQFAEWTLNPTRNNTRFVVWDTETNEEFGSQDVTGIWDKENTRFHAAPLLGDRHGRHRLLGRRETRILDPCGGTSVRTRSSPQT